MDCKETRDLVSELWGGELPREAQEHLSRCAVCERFWRDSVLVAAGFHALAEDAAPEASLGFASRLIRRLPEREGDGARSEFFETIGRRFVYATLALTLALLLSMTLPTAGPVRGVAGADFLGLQGQNRISQPDVIGGDAGDLREMNPGGPSD